MARVEVEGDDLVLRLSALEKVLSFGGDRRVPLRLVHGVEELARPMSAAMGVRAVLPYQRQGVLMPPVLMYGSRLTVAGWDLLAVRNNGRPTLLVECANGAPANRMIVSVADAAEAVRVLREALPRTL